MQHFHGSSLEVITGPMFSGKTEELIRRVRRAQIARQKIQIFKPATDNRYHEENVVSHNSQHVKACLLYTSPSPRDATLSRMPSSA